MQQKYGIDNSDFDYGGGWAVGEGSLKLEVRSLKFKEGNLLLARVMESSRGGKIEFYQGENKIGEINTRVERPKKVEVKITGYKEIPDRIFTYDKADFSWFEAGKLVSDEPLTIKTGGDINVVNALISISGDEWRRIDNSIHRYKINKPEDITLDNKTNVKISYERVAPTYYKVKIKGLKTPSTLVFSETYDSLWSIRHSEGGSIKFSFPLYSLINGFTVDSDGEYDIYFTPQKYVLPGLIVSGATLIFLIILLKRGH